MRSKHKEYNKKDHTSPQHHERPTDIVTQAQGSSTCKTPELANPATVPPIPHSDGSSEGDHSASPPNPLTHSQTLDSVDLLSATFSRQKALKTPPANASKSWNAVDEALDILLNQTFPSFNSLPPDKMLSALTQTVHFYFSNDSAEESKHQKNRNDPHHPAHETELKSLRRKKRSLRAQWRAKKNMPPSSTASLRSEFFAVHKRIKKLTAHRASIQKEATKRSAMRKFRADPFSFGKQLFHPKSSTLPSFSKEEALSHFVTTYTDGDRSSGYSA